MWSKQLQFAKPCYSSLVSFFVNILIKAGELKSYVIESDMSGRQALEVKDGKRFNHLGASLEDTERNCIYCQRE